MLAGAPLTVRAIDEPFAVGGATLWLSDTSASVDVYYRSMRFNRAAGVWNVEVVLSNRMDRGVGGPLILLIDQDAGAGAVQPDGVSAAGRGYFDLSAQAVDGALAGGAQTVPRTIALGPEARGPTVKARVFAAPGPGTAAALVRTLNEVGQPLGGVSVQVLGGPGSLTTDPIYGLATLTGLGDQTLLFGADGFLPVWRRHNFVAGVEQIASPRLVRRSPDSVVLTPIAGGSLRNGGVAVAFPPGAVQGDTVAMLTPLTGMTLPGLLPKGWSPLQAFWLECAAAPNASAVATLSPWGPFHREEAAALAFWDATALRWKTRQIVVSSGTNLISVSLPGAGAYALVVPDAPPGGPPSPVVGQPLGVSTLSSPLPADLTASGDLDPVSSPAATDPAQVTSLATVTVTHRAGLLASGLLLRGEVREEYHLRDGSLRVTPAYEHFITAYQRPGDALDHTLASRFPIRPLQLHGAEELDQAWVHVDVLSPTAFAGVLVETNGGQWVQGPLRVLVGAGCYATPQAVFLRPLDPSSLSALVPGGLALVTAFDLSAGPVQPGQRLVLQVQSAPAQGSFVLARVVQGRGVYGLEPVERLASDTQGRLTSLETNATARLPGLTGPGRYLLLQANAPQALVQGQARDSGGRAAGDLVVRLDPWVTFSRLPDGAFQLLAPAGSSQLELLDPATEEGGSTVLNVAAGVSLVTAEIGTSVSGPRVVSLQPADGAVAVPRVASVQVGFSRALNPATLLPGGVQFLDANQQPVPVSLSLNLANTAVTILPSASLAGDTIYTVALSPNLADANGRKLEGPARFTFRTETELLNRGLAKLTSYEPENGQARLVGEAGLAEPELPVILVNETTGFTATVLSKPDGSFSNSIPAAVDDSLSSVIVNRNGTRNVVTVSRQLFRDGRIGLFEAGGAIEAANEFGPMEFKVEPGSLEGRTVFRFEPVTLGALLRQLGTNQPADGGKVLGGFQLQREGPAQKQSADITAPINLADLGLEPGESPTNRVFALCRPVEVDGVQTFEVVDKMEYEDGRLVTHSPPFLGAMGDPALNTFTMVMMGAFRESHVVVGRVVAAAEDAGAITDASIQTLRTAQNRPILPVAGALVLVDRNASTVQGLRPGAITARANSEGFFAALVPYNAFNPEPIVLRAYHPGFSGLRAVKVFTPGGLSAGPLAGTAMHLVFRYPPGSATDKLPPQVFPAAPADILPVATNVVVSFRVLDDESAPTLGGVTFEPTASFRFDGTPIDATNVTITIGTGISEGARQMRYPVTLKVAVAGVVTVKVAASDAAGNSATAPFSFYFGGAPSDVGGTLRAADPDDRVKPTVLASWPDQHAFLGRETEAELVFRFSEPIDPLLATNAGVVLVGPGIVFVSPALSPNQLELRARLGGLEPGKNYTAVLQTTYIRDLSGNYLEFPKTLHFSTAPVPDKTLADTAGAVGTVSFGAFSFTIVRANGEGELQVNQIGLPSTVNHAASLRLPFQPRAILKVPEFTFTRSTNGVVETNKPLVIVVGGNLGADAPGQLVWVIDVSDPTHPQRIASEIGNPDPAAAFTALRWSKPFFYVNEINPEAGLVYQVNLQAFILGANGVHDPNPVRGVDANGDGDYVDQGDTLPIPERRTFFGLESVTTLAQFRHFDDFDVAEGGLTLAGVMPARGTNTARFQLVFAGGAFIGAGSSPDGAFDYGTQSPRRLLLDPDLPALGPLGWKQIRAALVAVGDAIDVLDLTDPSHPKSLVKVRLPAVAGATPGTIFTLNRTGPDEYVAGTGQGIFVLRRSLLSLPENSGDKPPAVERALGGLVAGRTAAATDLEFAGSLGGSAGIRFRDPYVRIMRSLSYPVTNISSVISAGTVEVRKLAGSLRESPYLVPASVVNCPTNFPSPLTNAPVPPGAHYYAVVRASGRCGAEIPVALESLSAGGELVAPLGKEFPPVLRASVAAQIALDTMQEPVEPLTARRLSDNPMSDDYNTFVTDPFVVVRAPLSQAEKVAIRNDNLRRVLIWAGDYVRCSIDPALSCADLQAYIGKVSGERYQPVVQRQYRTLRGEYLDSPNPSFPSAAPRFAGVDLQSGEYRHVQPDAFIEGREQDLVLTRVYESRSRYVGPFGRGWDFNLNARILELDDELPPEFRIPHCRPGILSTNQLAGTGDAMFFDGAGNALRFHLISAANRNETNRTFYASDPALADADFLGANGAALISRYYESPNGIFSVLYKLVDGTWWLLHPSGGQMFFDAGGRITKSKGRSKKSELVWKYRDDGKLDRVTGDRGIYLEFGYFYPPPAVINSGGFNDQPSTRPEEWGRICKVRAWSVLNNTTEVDYEYNDEGNLERVKPNFAADTVHAYDTVNPSLLLKVGRVDGTQEPGLSVSYDPKGLVGSVTVDGDTMTMAGAKETLAERSALPSSQVSFTRQTTGKTTTFDIDDKGRPTEFAGRPFEADDQGLPLKIADDVTEARLVYDSTNAVYRFRGNLLRTERGPVGGVQLISKMSYDGLGWNRLVSITDVNGVETAVDHQASQEKTIIGGVVTRTDRLNDYDQNTASLLEGGGDSFGSTIQFGSGAGDLDLPTGETPAGGVASTLGRNTKGQIETSGFGNRAQTVTYNDDGQPLTIQGTGTPSVTMTYHQGRVNTQTIQDGTQSIGTTTTYGDARFKSKPTDVTVTETGLPAITGAFTYDDHGRMTSMIYGGETTTFAYDGVRQTNAMGPGLNRSAAFDSEGRITKYTENAVTATFSYDGLGRTKESTQQGATTKFTYDDAGNTARARLKRKEIAEGASVLLAEDFTYDNVGRLDSITGQGGRVRTFTWFPDERVKAVKIDGTEVQSVERDSAGRVTKSTLNDIEVQFSSFDPNFGAAQRETVKLLPSNRSLVRQLTLDGRGRLKSVDAEGEVTDLDYDGFGNLTLMRDPDAVERRLTYSPSGKPLTVTFSDGTTATYAYTAQHRLDTVTTAAGTLDYAYGPDGLLSKLTYPDGDVMEFASRNAAFDPTTVLFGNGEVTQTLGYDSTTSRHETTTVGSDTISIAHDGLGRRQTASRGGRTITYLYNRYGEPSGETTSAGTWEITMDSRNRVTSEKYPSGLTVAFSPDQYGLPSAATALGIASFRWVGAGMWERITYQDGLTVERSYSSDLDLESIHYGLVPQGGGALQALAGYDYTLTDAARVLQEAVLHDGGRSHVYERYPKEQALRLKHIGFATESNTLASATVALTNLSYVNGELQAPAQGSLTGDPRGYFPDLQFNGQRVIAADGVAVTYNGRGSVTGGPLYLRLPGQSILTRVPATLEYDGFGMLQKVIREDGVTITYTRDALGRLVEREVAGLATRCEPGTTRYVWKGSRLIEEHAGGGTASALVRRYGYVGGTLVLVQRAATPGGALTDLVPLLNIVGSVGGYLATDGTLLERIDYTAYGYPVFVGNEGRRSTRADTLLMHGAWFDVETGLYQMGQRNLHPILGRFLQRDPAIFKESLAFYSAFNGDPPSRTDESGTFAGPLAGNELFTRAMELSGAAKEAVKAGEKMVPILNAVRGYKEGSGPGGFEALVATGDFLFKVASLAKQGLGSDEVTLEKAKQVNEAFQLSKDTASAVGDVVDLVETGLKLKNFRLASWTRDPKNAPYFGNLHAKGASFSLFDLDFDALRGPDRRRQDMTEVEFTSREFLGKLEEKRDAFHEQRKKLLTDAAGALSKFAQGYFEKSFGNRDEKVYKVLGGILETSNGLLALAEAFEEAKGIDANLKKFAGRASTFNTLTEVGINSKARSAVAAAFDFGFAAGKLIAVAVSDPLVAKIYLEQVKQFEEDGGWLTVGAGVLSTMNMDAAANLIQRFHDAEGFSLKPFAEAFLQQRARHQERTQFYLNGLDAP